MGLHWFTKLSISLTAIFLSSIVVMAAAPTASLTNTPSGTVTGGAGSLIPTIDNTAVSRAGVGTAANPPGDVSIGYRKKDAATADDGAAMVGQTSAPANDQAVTWRVVFSASGSCHSYTTNAPGDPAQGSYSTVASATIAIALSAPNHTTQSDSDTAGTSIVNDTSGDLTDPCAVTFGTTQTPKEMAGTWGENFTVTLTYNVGASVELKALRQEVSVGGKAFCGNVTGSMAAWYYQDPNMVPTLMKRTDDPTLDAVWTIQ